MARRGAPHPLLVAVEALGLPEIGRSSRGRPIFGGPAAGAAAGAAGRAPVLVLAGIHGDEAVTAELAVELVTALGATPPPGPVWIAPLLNPDGLASGKKNNARNVDLNRNFPARSFTLEHRPGYFPGERPLSEPESRALAALLERLAPRAIVALHAPFGCVNYDGPAGRWAEAVSHACGWPVRAEIGYPTPGSLGSWLGVDRGLPILTLELPAGPYAGVRAAAHAAVLAAINPPEIG